MGLGIRGDIPLCMVLLLLIDVLTGLVVDYVVLSKYCHACSIKKTEFGDHSIQFTEWYQGHKEQCSINYTGSSNAMEVEAACRLWQAV